MEGGWRVVLSKPIGLDIGRIEMKFESLWLCMAR